MERIVISERCFECEFTQLESAIKSIREIVNDGDCHIAITDNKIEFIDDYGNDVAEIVLK